ncbi:hypothetical protein BKA66DRAFT_136950 [Pyrenochaeta sp. MPI-SDFR-AT-0127]|nr:hypothetical protein BKA66DRAFT_136950 [Pyrenochaeta sp. MPI-SDFR-AT-0127]
MFLLELTKHDMCKRCRNFSMLFPKCISEVEVLTRHPLLQTPGLLQVSLYYLLCIACFSHFIVLKRLFRTFVSESFFSFLVFYTAWAISLQHPAGSRRAAMLGKGFCPFLGTVNHTSGRVSVPGPFRS